MQRAFDRSIALDECSIRRTAEDFENGVVIKNEKLEDVLSGHQLEEFLEVANRYYQETAKAKNGLWFPENALLERADLHPPMKNKILNVIVGQALGVSPAEGTDFIEEIWNRRSKVVRQFARFAMQSRMKERLTVLIFLRTTNSSKQH